jgi:hypothetical protein
MIIRVSRAGLTLIGIVFGLFHAVLGFASLNLYVDPTGPSFAIGIYLVALFSSILPYPTIKMPWWHGALAAVAAVALPQLVNPALFGPVYHSYATWYVGATGVLLCIVMVRQQAIFAWLGVVGVMASMVVYYEGFSFVGESGVLGGLISMVVAGQAVSLGVERGAREATRLSELASADLAAAEATSATRAERKVRVQKALENSLPLLKKIVERKGALSPAEANEAIMAEVALRDEIRGRDFMTDRVREASLEARTRGVEVVLLDEGGLDGVDPELRERILGDVANAIDGVQRGKVTVRTVKGEAWLVTVVATDNPNDPPTLWLRLP